MESTLYTRTVEPLAPYVGGKARLAEVIVQRIEAIPHELYAEPFGGIILGQIELGEQQTCRSRIF